MILRGIISVHAAPLPEDGRRAGGEGGETHLRGLSAYPIRVRLPDSVVTPIRTWGLFRNTLGAADCCSFVSRVQSRQGILYLMLGDKMRTSQRLMVVRLWARIVLGICLVCMSGCRSTDEAWSRVRETGVLRVGMDASFPPFEAVEPGGVLVGFDVALARELGRRMGVRTEFVSNLPYDGLYDALAVDRVDVVISALVVNPNRMTDVVYSDVYFDAGQVLIVPIALLGIEQMSDLAGRVVAVEFGTRGDLEVRKWARRIDGLTNLHCGTAGEAVAAVLSGTADAAVVDHVTALVWASGSPDLVITDLTLVSEPYAVAARIGSTDLIRVINKSLGTLAEDGTLDELTKTWLLSP